MAGPSGGPLDDIGSASSPPPLSFNSSPGSGSSLSSAISGRFWPQGMGSSVRTREAAEFVSSIARGFDSKPRLRFVKHLGIGRHGGTMLFERLNVSGQVMRKIVIKYSLGDLSPDLQSNADNDLRNEFHCLALLKGAEHIGQLEFCPDAFLEIPGVSDGNTTQPQPGHRRTPTIALEFIPNGTAFDMLERMADGNDGIPNRFLWRVFYCMVRQCIAMAFPPRKEWRDPVEREQIIPGQQMFDLTQNSNHLKNVMFGDLDPNDPEHRLVPLVKLIDFGRGAQRGTNTSAGDRYAPAINLYNAAEIITQIVWGDRLDLTNPPVPYKYTNRNNEEKEELTIAPKELREADTIDLELRDLLCRCYNPSTMDGPSLQEALDICQWQIQYKTPGNVQSTIPIHHEADTYIRMIVQRYIFDAPST
ncbi:hypothetical protein F4810DRAFT_309565 [Camillea tinctor]|nr:hypothetical protein F4810DRAFT_309565 [Camillea tinctor]